MSGFDGSRRGPNVSQYIANLNAIPSSHDVVNQHDGAYNLEEDLAVFTNAEFYDFDIGEDIDQQPMPYDPSQEERARRENAAPHKSAGKALDYSQNHGMSAYQVLRWDTRSGWETCACRLGFRILGEDDGDKPHDANLTFRGRRILLTHSTLLIPIDRDPQHAGSEFRQHRHALRPFEQHVPRRLDQPHHRSTHGW